VDIYSYAWTEDPIINSFIPESGATGILTAGDPTAVTHWFNVSQALGCGMSAAQSVACVRNQTMQAVLNAVAAVGASFVPVVDNVTIFSDYAARGAAGKFVKRVYNPHYLLPIRQASEFTDTTPANPRRKQQQRSRPLQHHSRRSNPPAGPLPHQRRLHLPRWRRRSLSHPERGQSMAVSLFRSLA
jgi:hypothetical protein